MTLLNLQAKSLFLMLLSVSFSFSSQIKQTNKKFIYFNNEKPRSFNNNKEKYVDPSFPLSKAIGNDSFYNKQILSSDIEFRRPNEIFGEDFKIFNKKIEANDSLQGGLGNCYLISVLAALAKYPHVIYNIFYKIRRGNGYYEIKIKSDKDNQWYIVIIDDLLPVDKKTGMFISTRTLTNEIWPLLIEKAWAKFKGSYSKTEEGSPAVAISSFTDFLPITYSTMDMQMESILKTQISKGSIVILISHPNESLCKNKEITPYHGYTLVRINQNQEIVVRNPWGKTSSGETITNGETNIPFYEIINNFHVFIIAEVDEKYKKLSKIDFSFSTLSKKSIIKGKMFNALQIYPQFKMFFDEMLENPSFQSDDSADLEFQVFNNGNTINYIGFVKLIKNTNYPHGIGVQIYNQFTYVYARFKEGNPVFGYFYNTLTKEKNKLN